MTRLTVIELLGIQTYILPTYHDCEHKNRGVNMKKVYQSKKKKMIETTH